MNIFSKLLFCTLLLGITANSYADSKTYANLQKGSGITKASIIQNSLFLAFVGSVVYTYFKPAPETVVPHENTILNFLDHTWCGNRQAENGTIQEGNRSRPYIIEARGVVGKAMKYVGPIAAFVSLAAAGYTAEAIVNLLYKNSAVIQSKLS